MVDGLFQQLVFVLDLFNLFLHLLSELQLFGLEGVDGAPGELFASF